MKTRLCVISTVVHLLYWAQVSEIFPWKLYGQEIVGFLSLYAGFFLLENCIMLLIHDTWVNAFIKLMCSPQVFDCTAKQWVWNRVSASHHSCTSTLFGRETIHQRHVKKTVCYIFACLLNRFDIDSCRAWSPVTETLSHLQTWLL